MRQPAPRAVPATTQIISVVPTKRTKAIEVDPPLNVAWGYKKMLGRHVFTYFIENFNRRWDTATDTLEGRIMGRPDAGDTFEQLSKEFERANMKMLERVGWIYAANHGFLDTEFATYRFKR